MHRFLGAALAAFLVLPVCADAKTVRIPPHRLALAPGMSVDIPDGWMACDPESNKALHNAPHIVAIEGFCGSVRARHERDTLKADIHVFIDSDPSTRLLMGSFFLSGFAVPDEYIAAVTPQLLAEVEDVYCKGIVADSGFPVSSCKLRPVNFGGRPAFIGETETKPTARGHFAGRFYMVSDSAGTMVFVFAAQAPITAKMQAVIDQVAGSMKVEAPVAAPDAGLVPLTPVAGLTLSVPKGWMSCDGATDAALGGMADPQDYKTKLCPPSLAADRVVRIFDPHAPYFETVELAALDARDPAAMAAHMTPEEIARNQDRDCRSISDPAARAGLAMTDCRAEAATFAGHAAQIVTLSETGKPASAMFTINRKIRAIYVPVGSKLFTVSLIKTSALTPEFDAAGEAVLKSVAFP